MNFPKNRKTKRHRGAPLAHDKPNKLIQKEKYHAVDMEYFLQNDYLTLPYQMSCSMTNSTGPP